MSYLKGSLFLISILLAAVGVVFFLAWLYMTEFTIYTDMKAALTITTETFGMLLGIITAGLMFTQAKFGELSSELSEKSPHYLTDVLSLEKIQSIGNQLVTLRKTFIQLAANTIVAEERNLYERIVAKTSLMFANFAVLLNLSLKQHGLPDTGLLISEMDSNLYKVYKKGIKSIKKEWQLFDIIRKTIDVWEAPASFLVEKLKGKSALQADLKGSIFIWKVKGTADKSLGDIRNDVTKTVSDLSSEISEISKRLHEDRIRQLLSQMEQASAVRGKYFYLAVVFITAPLLINLLILPQFTEATAAFFKPIISVTSSLSVIAVVFLLLYIYEILNV